MKKTRILFVCMGNICRSPTADGVMRKLVVDAGLQHMIEVDSAGTHGYHTGAPPDARSQAAALSRGYDLAPLRARHVEERDFEAFDLLLAMDNDNLDYLKRRCPSHLKGKLRLMMDFAQNSSASEVPDPYYEGSQGFEIVLDYIEDACAGLLDKLKVR
ncbi:MAG TPA: low molecular weight protein-tyrosine-phosphatase [Burkholderiaceae bacterium]|jgi:protein-tyrosine phosphatase